MQGRRICPTRRLPVATSGGCIAPASSGRAGFTKTARSGSWESRDPDPPPLLPRASVAWCDRAAQRPKLRAVLVAIDRLSLLVTHFRVTLARAAPPLLPPLI